MPSLERKYPAENSDTANARRADHDEEERRQRIEPQVERQVRQPEGKHGGLRRARQRRERDAGERQRDQRAGREQRVADEAEVPRTDETQRTDHAPGRDRGHHEIERRDGRAHFTRMPGSAPESGASR